MLAALAVAVGLALPDDDQDAEAQGVSVQAGYTYIQRQCQELGQQPRRYNVREPIPGSDWRNDGGWAIILVISGTPASTTITFTNPTTGGPYSPAWGSLLGRWITATDGTAGRVIYSAPSRVIVDRNGNGQIDSGDATYSGGNLERRDWQETTIPASGARYIRWANMLWCR